MNTNVDVNSRSKSYLKRMDARTLPHAFQTALVLFDALRRLGFDAADVFFDLGDNGCMTVAVVQNGQHYPFGVGHLDMSRAQFKERWREVAKAASDGEITQKSLDEIWLTSSFHQRGGLAAIAHTLLKAGARLPALSLSECKLAATDP